MDTWFPDEEKLKKVDLALEDEGEERQQFGTNCAKCGTCTEEHPELRGWWPAVHGKLCAQKSTPQGYETGEITWYCKQCYVQENGNIVLRVIRKLLH